jgi:hypothetical protein
MGNVLLAILSTVVALLIMEFGFRLYTFGLHTFSLDDMNGAQSIGTTGMVVPAPCPELVYSLKPGLSRSFKLAPLETNSHGLRDREYTLEKPPGTFRIAAVGDSYTMASGVPIEKAFHSLLEERLNADGYGMAFEVINFGVGGYGLEHYAADLDCQVRKWDPDMILLGFYPRNDQDISPAWTFEKTFEPKPREYPAWSSFAFHELVDLVAKSWNRNFGPPQAPEPTDEQVAHMKKWFARIGDWSRENRVPVLVAYLTYRKDDDVRPEFVAELAAGQGFDFVDLSRGFRAEDRKKYRNYLTDSHPNPAAHRIFADELHEHLVERAPWRRR